MGYIGVITHLLTSWDIQALAFRWCFAMRCSIVLKTWPWWPWSAGLLALGAWGGGFSADVFWHEVKISIGDDFSQNTIFWIRLLDIVVFSAPPQKSAICPSHAPCFFKKYRLELFLFQKILHNISFLQPFNKKENQWNPSRRYLHLLRIFAGEPTPKIHRRCVAPVVVASPCPMPSSLGHRERGSLWRHGAWQSRVVWTSWWEWKGVDVVGGEDKG